MISVGDEAPDFELPSSEPREGRPGDKVKLSDHRGKPVLLVFYPLDFSPVCTGENSCFRDDLPKFAGSDVQIFGISVDSAWTHQAFANSLKLPYPLLADFHPKGEAADRFGLYHADKGITARASVLIDKDGKVAFVQEEPLGEARDNTKILEAVAAL